MKRFTSLALRVCAPLVGVLLVSGVASAKVVTETWQVQGVHNAGDEAKIRDALSQLPTVAHPTVNMSTVRVTFDDQKVSDATLSEAVTKAGSFKLTNKLPAKAAAKASSATHAAAPAAAAAKAHKS